MNKRSVMMIQMGARRNYVYAHQLEEEGLLHSLVCDAAWAKGHVSWPVQAFMKFSPRLEGPITRRTIAGVDPARIRASFLPNITGLSKLFFENEQVYSINDEALGVSARFRGLNEVQVIVNYTGNGGQFLDHAKSRGIKIVTDFVSHPKYWEIVDAERQRWSGWEQSNTASKNGAYYRRRIHRLVSISDIYLCPSASVAAALAEFPGFDAARVRIVPYGVSGVVTLRSKPERGRVLFAASTVSVTKGIPYLAEAAKALRQLAGVEVIVAGSASAMVRARPETSALTFLGPIDRQRMAQEFARADVFCLPSLAEGSATVVFEALANGVPVVTTAASGSVVQDGLEGFIVPERNSSAIVEAIMSIFGNRNLRERMSTAARAAAVHYSDSACGDRFISVIRSLLDNPR